MLQFLLLKYSVMSQSVQNKILCNLQQTSRYAADMEYLNRNLYSVPNYRVFLHVSHTACIDMLPS